MVKLRLRFITGLIATTFLVCNISIAYANGNVRQDNQEKTQAAKVIDIREYNSVTDSSLIDQKEDTVPNYVIETAEKAIPMFVGEKVDASAITKQKIQVLLDSAAKSKLEDVPLSKMATERYELTLMEDDYTYTYADYPENSFIEVIPTNKKSVSEANIQSTVSENSIVGELSPPITTYSYETPVEIPGGIGTRAITMLSNDPAFSARVYSPYKSFSDSDKNLVTFYNYIGYTGGSDGAESDLGLQWGIGNSTLPSAFQPYFKVVKNGITYTHNSPTSYTSNLSNRYPGNTAERAVKIFINRQYDNDNKKRVKLTVTGITTSGSSGTSSVIGGLGTSGSARYKVNTMIAANNESYIKPDTAINSSWDIINIGTSPVTMFYKLEAEDGVISTYYPKLNVSVQKR
ncbi:MAG: hypothetical protein ACOX4L_02075 [Bacillota bacterium]|jgi:hypothetical protein